MAMTENEVTVVELKDGKVIGEWNEPNLQAARDSVNSLKITGPGKVYSIENRDGRVVEVIKKSLSGNKCHKCGCDLPNQGQKGMTRAEDLQPGTIVKLPTRQWARLVEVRGDLAGKLGKVPVKVENAPGYEELSRFEHWFRPGEMVETK